MPVAKIQQSIQDLIGIKCLLFGLMFFPTPDFSQSLLVGILIPIDFFNSFIKNSLLFVSFCVATLGPILTWKIK